ncbi:TPA: hypothetical protein ACH3X1_006952 [Trebouxia sp. C0004]
MKRNDVRHFHPNILFKVEQRQQRSQSQNLGKESGHQGAQVCHHRMRLLCPQLVVLDNTDAVAWQHQERAASQTMAFDANLHFKRAEHLRYRARDYAAWQ